MDRTTISAVWPYAVLLAAACVFYAVADGIDYAHRPGQLGPDFWPKAALVLIGAVSVFEIVKVLVFHRTGEAQGIAASLGESDDASQTEEERYPRLLVAGSLLTIGYGAAITWIGFPLATFLFIAAFIYLGRYRSHLVIWLSAAIGTFVFAVLFLKIVYVSLPRGVPPFDRITDAVINLF